MPVVTEMTDGVERIQYHGEQLGLIVRADFDPHGIQFLTEDAEPLQLGVMRRPKDHVIAPHTHKPTRRIVDRICEVLYVVEGRVEVTFFTEQREVVCVRELVAGDCVMLISGGHGFRVLEDCKMIEVKQGPYEGLHFDKFRF